MIDYLTYYYHPGAEPFQSISTLSDGEAIRLMQALYVEGSVVWERFKDPAQYLRDRKETEQWVREQFIAKGGRPQAPYPISMVLGRSRWIERYAGDDIYTGGGAIRIPLSAFAEGDVSFTYPDSMISHWLGRDKPAEYYLPEVHGKVFTRSEILVIVERERPA